MDYSDVGPLQIPVIATPQGSSIAVRWDVGPLQIPVIATWRYQWEHLHKVLRPIEDKNNKTKDK